MSLALDLPAGRWLAPSAAWLLPPLLVALPLLGVGLGASFVPPGRVLEALAGASVRSASSMSC